MADRWISDLFLCLLFVSTLMAASPNDDSTCDSWAQMAQGLTGNGKLQMCDNNKTDECTRFDCEGTLEVPERNFGLVHIKAMTFDYCYGIQLNSCSDPVSMDFYLDLPSHNFTWVENIEHNEMQVVTGLKIPVGKMGTASPVFLFTMEKKQDGFVSFSVVLELKAEAYGMSIFVPGLKQTLVNNTRIPAKTCTSTSGQKPASHFEPGDCHVTKYPVAPTEAPVVPAVKPSATLNKACDVVHKHCSHREVCDLSLKKPVCHCGSDFQLSPKQDACIPYSKIRQPCRSMADCGYNEQCGKSDTKSLVCLCSKGYQYNAERELCMIVYHPHKAPTVPPTHGGHKHTNTTSKPKVNGDTAKSGFSKYIIIGASVGAVVVIVLIFVGFVCYKRRRNVIRINLNDYTGAQPLLSDAGDDDVNIIM